MLLPVLRLLTGAAAVLQTPTIQLPTGATVTGTLQTNAAGHDVRVFRGIPYAEPPVGQNRWKQAKLKPLTSDLNATVFGNTCYAVSQPLDPDNGKFPQSEDCLFLNVYTPAGATKESNYPVMVWIHGGAFVLGSSSSFDGSNLIGPADQKLVVVTLNYRLGVFGFLSNKAILGEGDGANFGLRDQETAFQWVKQHIQAFGGNPEDITGFGESAGAVSMGMQMIAREGDQQLFHKAIIQSGAYMAAHEAASPSLQITNTATITSGVGCAAAQGIDELECLRKASANAVFSAGESIAWRPTVDGVFIKDAPIRRVRAGKVSDVPLIMGTNTDEGWLFTLSTPNASQYDTFVRANFPLLNETEHARVAELYPAEAFATPQHRMGEIFADVIFVCPVDLFTLSQVKNSQSPTFRYRFNYTSNEFGLPLVVHAKDIAFVFNQQATLPTDDTTKAVVGYFQTYWTNFATTGSPNGAPHSSNEATNTPFVWPLYTEAKQRLVIQPTLGLETSGAYMPRHDERCSFWYEVDERLATHLVE